MDKCQFSEFSYGYCLTEDLVVGKGTPLTAAPVFPSLAEEGKEGVGYDVRLNRPGIPLFLQFKLVHQMVRGNANEVRAGHFQPPFYRMHFRSRAISDQHQSLISLEQAGNEVFYAAPSFHTISALNNFYAKRQVWDSSFRIRPVEIGPLPDDKTHHVSFQKPDGIWRFYSEEASREGRASTSDQVAHFLERRIVERGKRNLFEQLPELDEKLQEIIVARNAMRGETERINIGELGVDIEPIRRVAYIARQFFGCQLLFVTEK